MIDNETRRLIAQAIAKCIAYKNCGKQELCDEWALKLLDLLECQELIEPIQVDRANKGIYKKITH